MVSCVEHRLTQLVQGRVEAIQEDGCVRGLEDQLRSKAHALVAASTHLDTYTNHPSE